jgi:DNA repair exonuclease SbcCD ATPase subunit
MKFHYLDVHAFNRIKTAYRLPLHNQGLVLVEGENRDGGSLIPGNGAGKSLSIVETLTWGMHGRMVRYDDQQVTVEAVHPVRGADVALEVELRNLHHRVHRQRPPNGAARLTLTTQDPSSGEWMPLPQSKDPRRDAVEALFGLDYTAFRYAVVVQGSDALAADGFSTQMAVLETLLRLDELGVASEEARRRTTQRDKDLAVARATASGAARSLEEAEETLRLLEEVAAGDVAARQQEEVDLQRRRAAAVNAQALLPDAQKLVAATGAKMEQARQARIVADSAATPLIKERQQLEKRLGSLVCPSCNRPYGTKAEAEKQQAKTTARITAIDEELQVLGRTKDAADRIFQELNQKQYAQAEEVRRLERATATLADIDAQLAALADREKERTKHREFLEGRITALRAEVDTAQAATAELAVLHRRSSVWVAGYGRDGLQADLFALGVPELNRAAQRYSEALTGQHLRVSFNPQRESRRDNLILIEGATAPTYKGCSRGEKERINLIVAFSLRALARWRLGEPINLSVFDEVFDHVDPGGLQAIATLLQAEIAATGGTIFVVTHNPTLKALFPGAKLMRVVREGGEATVFYG